MFAPKQSMTCKVEHIVERLKRMPMVTVVVPFAIGIFIAESLVIPIWSALLLLAVALAGGLWLRGAMRNVVLLVAVAAAGVALHTARCRDDIDYDKRQMLRLRFEESSLVRNGRSRTAARIVKAESASLEGCRIVAWSDSTRCFSAGDCASARTTVRRFNPKYESYARLMHYRGFAGSASIGEVEEFVPSRRKRLHEVAVERLSTILEADKAGAVVLAMTTGSRASITPELRQAYSRSGTSHILAVSGMHVGILFLLINALIYPLAILQHGNIIKSVVAVAAIWSFVALCGLPPSAVRAAVMFSALQLSLHIPGRYSSGNIWAATAFAMLLCDSNLLFDISFQLSFIAVAGIIFWGVPLYNALRSSYRPLNALTASLVVGVVSSAVTMPLIAHTFGIVSIIGVVLNPLVILSAYIILLFGITSLAIAPLAEVAHLAARLQNGAVEWAASHESFYIDGSLTGWQVALIYGLYAATTVAIWSIGGKKRVHIDDNL